jgi:hypothetical protein
MNNQSKSAPGASQWDYKQVLASPVDDLMRALDNESQDGWELVCVTVEEPYYRAFLRRPKNSNPTH